MATCGVVTCGNDATAGWQRWASAEEIEQYQQSGDLPPNTTEARLPVYGCGEHKITDTQMGYTHDSDCTAPATCDCSVKNKPPFVGTDASMDH